MHISQRIKLRSFLLHNGENIIHEVQVDGDNLTNEDVVRVARGNAEVVILEDVKNLQVFLFVA